LFTLIGELGELLRQDHPAIGRFGLPVDDLRFQLLGELLHPRGRKLDSPIQVLDERLGVAGEDVGLSASGASGSALAQAVEIQVFALGKGERETPPALSAVRRPFR
jgi:hypothetical protein